MFFFFLAVICLGLLVRHLLEKLELGELERRPVVITGCDSGFGYLLALKLVAKGMPTFAGCLTEKGEEALRKQAGHSTDKLTTFHLDVTNQDSINKAVSFVTARLSDEGLWGLVNNAGIAGISAPDDWITAEDYQKAMDVNTFGVIRVTQAFKHLIKPRQGRIVVVTSILGRIGLAGIGPYSVSKHATEGYCDVIRRELEHFKVTVHILEPGFFRTNITSGQAIWVRMEELWRRQPDSIKRDYGYDFIDRIKEYLTRRMEARSSERLDHVVDCYYHALAARFPRHRYGIGLDAQFLFLPLSLMPTAIQDWVLIKINIWEKVPLPCPETQPRPVRS